MPIIIQIAAPEGSQLDQHALVSTIILQTDRYVRRDVVLDVLEENCFETSLIQNLYQLERTDEWFMQLYSGDVADDFVSRYGRSIGFHSVTLVIKQLNHQSVDVRLHWVPCFYSNDFVRGFLKNWGTITDMQCRNVSARRQCIYDVKFDCTLEQAGNLPHLIEVSDGRRILVTVQKRTPMCIGCKELGHVKFACPRRYTGRSAWSVTPPTPYTTEQSQSQTADQSRDQSGAPSQADVQEVSRTMVDVENDPTRAKQVNTAKFIPPSGMLPPTVQDSTTSVPHSAGTTSAPQSTGATLISADADDVIAGYNPMDTTQDTSQSITDSPQSPAVTTGDSSLDLPTTPITIPFNAPVPGFYLTQPISQDQSDQFGSAESLQSSGPLTPGQRDPKSQTHFRGRVDEAERRKQERDAHVSTIRGNNIYDKLNPDPDK
jgi:hypothetical protein